MYPTGLEFNADTVRLQMQNEIESREIVANYQAAIVDGFNTWASTGYLGSAHAHIVAAATARGVVR